MKPKQRQLTVAGGGFAIALVGILLRLIVLDPRTHNFIACVASFGRIPKAKGPLWDIYDGASVHNMLAVVAYALFYAGVVLVVASVIAWLFSAELGKDEDAA
jgi:hypothetical protein